MIPTRGCWCSGVAAVLVVAAAVAASDEPLSDAEIELILAKGKITRKEDVGAGVTQPKRLWIERDGVTLSASYKSVDLQRRGVTRFASGKSEVNFTDSYRYERAAYLLDRELGLGMVPVTVVRKLYQRPGAVTLWVEDSITEEERLRRRLKPPDMNHFLQQKADMRIFDALILNTDRHPGNELFTLTDWRLHLIDHSRAFRTQTELPEAFAATPTTMSREMLRRLERLEQKSLKKLLGRDVGPHQIRSLLARRDLILEKFARDRQGHGDAVAFREGQKQP